MGNIKLLIISFIVIVNSYKVTARGPTSQYLPPNAGGVSHAGSVGGQTQYQTSSSHRSSTQYSQHGAGGTLSRFGSNAGGAVIPILRNDFHNDGYGNYNFGFETGNGIRREENGIFENIGPEGSLNVHGSYSYTGDDGRVYSVNYKADSSGFHAEGDHLPTPPTVPQHSQQQQQTLRLHQPGGSGSFSSFGGGGGGSGNVRHHQPASSFNSPNVNYLPPSASGSSSSQSSGYNYNRHH